MMRALLIALIIGWSQLAFGESELRLTQVLDSVVRYHPRMEEARSVIEGRRGDHLALRSRFEPRAVGSGVLLPAGYYDYWTLAASVEQAVPGTGIELAGGYRLGQGNIPDYYGERETLSGGELFATLKIPLLANRAIDSARSSIRKARLAVSEAEHRLNVTWLEVARDASLAYWKWVAAGHKLRVAERLLEIAEARLDQLDAQSRGGALPGIITVDAERVVLARKSKLLSARAEFLSAQQQLSLYHRDQSSGPVLSALERVPAKMGMPPRASLPDVEEWIAEALTQRPELRVLEQQQRQAEITRRLAENSGLPALDLTTFAARDLGSGPESLSQTDFGVGIRVSVPLFRREARGGEQSARAKLTQLAAKRRLLRDQMVASIRENSGRANWAHERVELAQRLVEATERLAEGERIRLREGASDVLTVNLRELDVAAAAEEVIDASLTLHEATVNLIYARGTLPAPTATQRPQ